MPEGFRRRSTVSPTAANRSSSFVSFYPTKNSRLRKLTAKVPPTSTCIRLPGIPLSERPPKPQWPQSPSAQSPAVQSPAAQSNTATAGPETSENPARSVTPPSNNNGSDGHNNRENETIRIRRVQSASQPRCHHPDTSWQPRVSNHDEPFRASKLPTPGPHWHRSDGPTRYHHPKD